MDDSLSKMIEMIATVILFVFALSSAVFSYSRLNDNAEQLIGVNVINRRGTTASQDLNSGEIYRKTDVSEIIFAVYEMEKAATINGAGKYTIEISFKRLGYERIMDIKYELEYSEKLDDEGNVVLDENGDVVTIATPKIYMQLNGSDFPESPFTLDESQSKSDNYGTLIGNLKSNLGNCGLISSKFTVSYTTGKLIFTEVS